MTYYTPDDGAAQLVADACRGAQQALRDLAREGWLDGRDPLDAHVAAEAVTLVVDTYQGYATASRVRDGVRTLTGALGNDCLEAFAVGLAVALRDGKIRVGARSPRTWVVAP